MSDKPATITYDDFAKLDLRIATVEKAEPHPNADKLIVLQLSLGGEGDAAQRRQIVAGLRGYYEPADLVGRQIVIVANLAPRMMRGLESQGMLLAASNADRSKVIFVTPEKPVEAGSGVS
jgi:methionyl-tRNA synthetase